MSDRQRGRGPSDSASSNSRLNTAERNANGFFQGPSSTNNSNSSSSSPKMPPASNSINSDLNGAGGRYRRNPETGVYERNVPPSPSNNNNNSNGMNMNNDPAYPSSSSSSSRGGPPMMPYGGGNNDSVRPSGRNGDSSGGGEQRRRMRSPDARSGASSNNPIPSSSSGSRLNEVAGSPTSSLRNQRSLVRGGSGSELDSGGGRQRLMQNQQPHLDFPNSEINGGSRSRMDEPSRQRPRDGGEPSGRRREGVSSARMPPPSQGGDSSSSFDLNGMDRDLDASVRSSNGLRRAASPVTPGSPSANLSLGSIIPPVNGERQPREQRRPGPNDSRRPSLTSSSSRAGERRSAGSRSRSRSSAGRERDTARVGGDDNFEVSEQEKLEFEKQKQDLERANAARKAAERRELEMVANARKIRMEQDRERRNSGGNGGRRGSSSDIFSLISKDRPDESLLVPDYVTALMTALRNDDTPSPVPEDFSSREDFRAWRQSMAKSLQQVLIKMIKYRFLVPPDPNAGREPVKLFFRVCQARDLVGKEGRGRNTYCDIEYGDLAAAKSGRGAPKKRDVFRTEVVADSLNPKWDEKMTIEVKSIEDEISLQVFDEQKQYFLGGVTLKMGQLISECARANDGSLQKWLELNAREAKYRDKYVGGQIMVAARVEEKKSSSTTYQEIQNTVRNMGVDSRALFDIILRSCLVLDLYTPREGRAEVLSPESTSMLKTWARSWNISEPYQLLGYLKIIFEKYMVDAISISDFLKALHFLYGSAKGPGNFTVQELRASIDLMDKMKEHCGNRVTNYKELFPKNHPKGALESTILVLRIIHRFPTFRDRHPELPESFKSEIRVLMTESCISRFQRFKELSTPLDEGDVESVIEGINKLADLVNQEIEMDALYFQPAFIQELDIVRLTAEIHLKYFTLVLEDGGDVLGGDSAVSTASHHVFQLYKTLRLMAERYAKSVEGLTSMTTGYIESWFAPFMYKWLAQLSKKTIVWVEQAVRADSFTSEAASDGVPLHSSSITDVFSAIYSELEFITDLKWTDPIQNAQFFQAFAKTVNIAIEQYCDAIASIEKKAATSTTVTDFTYNFLGVRGAEPKDIETESCAKLRNIAFAMTKLREMYRMMNVTAIARNVKDHRKSMAITKKNAVSPVNMNSNQDFVTGAFKIHVSYAENLKPTNKNGLSNPYVVLRIPEGTLAPVLVDNLPRKKTMSPTREKEPLAPLEPTVLKGNACELFRSRVVNETLNPNWDETHSVILPPVERLEVAVFSKNLLTADEVDGTAIIDLSIGTRLRRKITDHHTHDIYVELEPQGRVLLRLTMEGEEEDVDFWFRRTNERLIRTRDSFLRSLTSKITPYISQILTKALKDDEAAPLPAKNYFSSLIAAVEYSDKTAAGHPITEKVQESDAVIALTPLIEYLEKNLETLCSQLPPLMAQAIIQRIWNDALTVTINNLTPPLFGLYTQKFLNVRQVSMALMCISILRDFMHGDGGEFGLSYEKLDTNTYFDLIELLRLYHIGIPKLRREYELSLLGGHDKELLIRLVRLQVTEKDSPDSLWIENQLTKRREQSRAK